MPAMPADFFPLGHLWFLYQLLLIYVAVVAVRSLVARLDPAQKLRGLVDKAVSGIDSHDGGHIHARTPGRRGADVAALLVLLDGHSDSGHVADSAAPGVGRLRHRIRVRLAGASLDGRARGHRAALAFESRASRSSPPAGCCTPCTPSPWRSPGLTKTVYALVFGVAVWGWVLGLTGAALRFLSNYSATRRYIADASYWIYLAHLPVVAALQIWVSHWPLHWGVKFPFILVVSFTVLFLSYHFLVRPTFIGQLLNGRKYPRKRRPAGASPSPRRLAARGYRDGGAGRAATRHHQEVRRRYRAQSASTSKCARGELLAVLGPNGAGKSTAISLWLGLIEAGCRRSHAVWRLAAGHRTSPPAGRDDAGRRAAQELRVRELVRSPPATTPIRSRSTRRSNARVSAVANRPTANSPAARSARFSSRWRSAAARSCCSSTSPPWVSTSRRAKRCGRAFARCSPTAVPSC